MTTLRSEAARPLIGRSELVHAIANDRVVVLIAEPGAGKSRVLLELATLAPEAIVATVRCHRGVVSTLEPLEALAESAARRLKSGSQKRAGRAALDDAERLVLLRERFEEIAAVTPLLVQIDDIHWAPRATLDAIAFCIDRTRDSAIRWQLATRPLAETPDPLEALRREPECRMVDLPLLDAKSTTELARTLGGDAASDLHRLTGGNPLYIEQWLLARARPGTASTLRATLEVRARDIPERGAELAALVALAERPLTVAEIAGALGKEPGDVRVLADDLEALGILRIADDDVEFIHDLLRAACVGMLDDAHRTAIREKLLTIARDEFERAQRLLAVHRYEEAAGAYTAAARAALVKYAYAETREIAERLRLLPSLSRATQWQLMAIDAILANLDSVFTTDRARFEAFLSERDCVDSQTRAFYLEQMLAVLTSPDEGFGTLVIDSMIDARDIEDGERSAFVIFRAKSLYGRGLFAEGLALTEAFSARAGLCPEHAFELRCMHALFCGTTDVDDGRKRLLSLANDPANRELAAFPFVYHVLAVLEDSIDDNAAVIHWAKLGLALRGRSDSALYYYLATSCANLGRLSEALDACEAALGVLLSRGALHRPAALQVHVETYAWKGEFSRAHALLDAGAAGASVARVRNARALIAEFEGRTGEALQLYASVADELAIDANTHGAIALAGLVRLQCLRGDVADARGAYDRLVSGTSQTAFSWRERAESDFYLALANGGEPDVRRAYASLSKARVPVLNVAVALARMGERFRDRDALVEATATFERCGATLHAERTRRIAQGFGFRFGSKSVARNALTEREADIARLIAAGRTNREIADLLHVSPKTIAANIGAMLERYGLRSRVEIAANMASGKPFERV